MGCILRLAFQGVADDCFHLRVGDFARLTRPWLIQQSINAAAAKTFPPLADRLNMKVKMTGDFRAGVAFGKTQNNASAQRQRLR